MVASNDPYKPGTYNNGQPYIPARGRYAPREELEDRLAKSHAVVDLQCQHPTPAKFIELIAREMKIRYYQPKTIKSYGNALRQFFRWFGRRPHELTREDVRNYLEFMVDGGADSSWTGVHLSAIRTAFDKMCGRDVTLGLLTPRRAKRLPVVLGTKEILRLLTAAICLRDKLLLGLLYATGMRVSEVARLRWRDVDFQRRAINVWQGKGRKDRLVLLPRCYEHLLQTLAENTKPDDYLFPGQRPGRHISPRTIRRIMQRTLKIAGIRKAATPHSLRHSYATHSVESGMDIRFISRLLGHVRLETTKIYTKLATPKRENMQSPLDVLTGESGNHQPGATTASTKALPSVGRMQIHMRLAPDSTPQQPNAQVTLQITTDTRPIYLTGIVVHEPRPGWQTLEVPPLEEWEEALRWLTPAQKTRIEMPEFYQMLEGYIRPRFLALKGEQPPPAS